MRNYSGGSQGSPLFFRLEFTMKYVLILALLLVGCGSADTDDVKHNQPEHDTLNIVTKPIDMRVEPIIRK